MSQMPLKDVYDLAVRYSKGLRVTLPPVEGLARRVLEIYHGEWCLWPYLHGRKFGVGDGSASTWPRR